MVLIFLLNCELGFSESEPEGFTPETQLVVDKIMDENPGASYDVIIVEESSTFGFSTSIAFRLEIFVEDKVVLTNTIDSLKDGIYRFETTPYNGPGGIVYLKFNGIAVRSSKLDSIEIRTDSVIVTPYLSLGDCNLTHLPPEIGKIRTAELGLSYNCLKELPLEIMQILDPPKCFKYTSISMNGLPNLKHDSLPDTLKDWFENVYSNQDFSDGN